MSGTPRVHHYFLERQAGYEGLRAFVTGILKLDFYVFNDTVTFIIDRVLNETTLQSEVNIMKGIRVIDISEGLIKVSYNKKYRELLNRYMNLFARELYEKVNSLNIRPPFSFTSCVNRPIFIYKGEINKHTYLLCEYQN